MTQRFVKFASLFAVVALFLGLMVTGCSEGNNTPGEVGAKTLLNTVVGISPEVAGKGGYADAATKYLTVGVMNKDGLVYVDEEAVGDLYSADGKIGAEAQEVFEEMFSKDITATAWEDLGNNEVLTSMVLDEYVLAQNPTGIAVFAFDKSGNPLGVFKAGVDFNAQGITTVDLVEEGTEFIAVKDMDCVITVANAGEDKVMHLATGESKEVEVQAVYSYKGEKVGKHSVAGFTMATESENIAPDNTKGTVKGLVASEAKDNEVTVTWTHPITDKVLTCTFNVAVEGLYVALTCADGVLPDWSKGEYVMIDQVTVNGEEQLEEGQELKWDGSTKDTEKQYLLKDIPVADGDKVTVSCVKHDADENEFPGVAEEVIVSASVVNNVIVTEWRALPDPIRVTLVNNVTGVQWKPDTEVQFTYKVNDGGFTITKLKCDGTQELTIPVNVKDGDKVVVSDVSFVDGTVTYYGQFDGEGATECTVNVEEGAENAATIVGWKNS